jgi:class 3 adenylate cyclase/TolB-like protein/tetratricopeptide (TPR) repeat protein
MAGERAQRHLAAILAADVVGYSRLMEQDEADTFARLRTLRVELLQPEIESHQGRIFKLLGDGLLAEFGSVVDAVECAVILQRGMTKRNDDVPEGRRIDWRIGVTLGDVIVEGEDRYGEGVNIANRLQQFAEPNGIAISRQAYDQVESKLDLTFEDLGEHVVKNIVKPVHVYRVRDGGARASRGQKASWQPRLIGLFAAVVALVAMSGGMAWYMARKDPILSLPGGPSIAILSFASLNRNPDDVGFNIGLTEDIITALSRFSTLVVFSRESTRNFPAETSEPRQIRRELGADFVLTGSIQRSADQLRVTARLLNALDGTPVWSEAFNRKLTVTDVFAVQDEITERIVGTIASSDAPQFKRKKEQLRATRPDSLAAYECVLLSIWVYDDFKEEAHARARECLERTVESAPKYALAWAHLAQMYFEEHKYGWNARPDPIKRAQAAVRRALELDPQEQYGRYINALILYTCQPSFEAFYAEAERGIALNPNNSMVLADLGLWMIYSGAWNRGRPLVEKATILNPLHPDWYHWAFFLDYYHKGDYRAALGVQLKMNQPMNAGIQVGLAAVYGQLGETKKAQAVRDAAPKFFEDPRAWFVRRRFSDDLLKHLMDGLYKAGLKVPLQTRRPQPTC